MTETRARIRLKDLRDRIVTLERLVEEERQMRHELTHRVNALEQHVYRTGPSAEPSVGSGRNTGATIA